MVAVVQGLFWRGPDPVLASGELDTAALARGLASARCGEVRRFYSRAQHAVVVSRGVERLATLGRTERRVIAMHAWLADLRASWLTEKGAERLGARHQLALRMLDIEAVARVLAEICHWGAAQDKRTAHGTAAQGIRSAPRERAVKGGGASSRGEGVDRAPAEAAVFEASLARLKALGPQARRRLALYALLTETAAAGLGTDVAESVLAAAGLNPRVPKGWADSLKLVRRMAQAAVLRDVRDGAVRERPKFPALEETVEPLEPQAAARCWLERYGKLTAAAPAGSTAARGKPGRCNVARGDSSDIEMGDNE